jgi:hypothetical protein
MTYVSLSRGDRQGIQLATINVFLFHESRDVNVLQRSPPPKMQVRGLEWNWQQCDKPADMWVWSEPETLNFIPMPTNRSYDGATDRVMVTALYISLIS